MDNITFKPPCDIEAEQAALGCIIISPKLLANSGLTADSFYEDTHKTIWRAMWTLGYSLDCVTLYSSLLNSGSFTDAEAKNYIGNLQNTPPTLHNFEAYVKTLKEKQALRDIEKITTKARQNIADGLPPNEIIAELAAGTANATQHSGFDSISICAADVKCKEVPWLIENFLVRGGLNSIQGLPSGGKSWVSLATAASVARGGAFPSSDGTLKPVTQGKVLIANFDDSAEYTIVPRLKQLGAKEADLRNIEIIKLESNITFNSALLARKFEEVKPDLAIFDTLQHFIGAGDMHKANEMNAALMGVKRLAEKHNTAVLIVQHITKQAGNGNSANSVGWGVGSIAINGLFRSVWTVGKLNLEGRGNQRAIVSAKNNLIPFEPPVRLFGLSKDHGFMWEGIGENINAFDLITGEKSQGKREAHRPAEQRTEAEQIISEAMACGLTRASDIENYCAERGVSRATYFRAKKTVSVS